MTSSNDEIRALIAETNQITRSNAKAIEALSADVAANRVDIAALTEAVTITRASVEGLVQTIAEYAARNEARLSRLENNEVRLNRLEDAVVGIEQILERLTRPNH